METVIKICFVVVFLGVGHTNALEPDIYVQGDNATVRIKKNQTDANTTMEIYFSAYTSKQKSTNVMLYYPWKDQHNTSISTDYTGRVQVIATNHDSFSFLLLNVTFMDSGNFTVWENSKENGKTSIIVTRRTLIGQLSKPMILPFMCNNANASSIKIYMTKRKDYIPFSIFNVAQKNCSYVGQDSTSEDLIESCVLSESNFYLTIRELTWLEKGARYIAWDDKGFLLDSILIYVRDMMISSPRSTDGYLTPSSDEKKVFTTFDKTGDTNQPIIRITSRIGGDDALIREGQIGKTKNQKKTVWALISSVVVVLVAACLTIIVVRKLRQRKVLKTTTNNLIERNGRQNTANSSRNGCKSLEEAPSPEEFRMISTTINNADDLTDFTNNRGQGKVKQKEKHNHARGLGSAKSPTRTTRELQIHSNLSSTEKRKLETAHRYNYSHKCVQVKNDCRLDEPYLRSTESIAGPSFEYDYVVQHSHMTLRPPAKDPVVTKNNKEQVITTDSILWDNKIHKKSSSRVDPSILYAKVVKKRNMDPHCTGFSAEHGSNDCIKELTPPGSFELEDSADLNSQGVSQSFNYDLARNICDDSSTREKEHRRSQSCGLLNGDLMVNASIRRSRRKSVRTFMNEDYYDSL